MITRRDLFAIAGASPALLPVTAAAAQPPAPQPEEHEFIQKLSSFDKVARGVVFHCTTSRGKGVDIAFTVCTSEIMRLQMCPDPQLKQMPCLLEIKEKYRVQVRGDFLDAFNRHTLGSIDTNVASPTFGQVTGVLGTRRIIQLGARLDF